MTRDKYTDKAAQLWCLPQHAKKEMDVEFAQSIVQALREVAAEAFEEVARALCGSCGNDNLPKIEAGRYLHGTKYSEGHDCCASAFWAKSQALREQGDKP